MYTFFSNVEHVSAKAYHVCAKKTTCDHMFSAVHGVCVGFNALSHILEELGDVANCLTKVCCHKYPFPVLSSLDRHHTSIVCRPWLLPNIRTGKLHQHTTQKHESPRHILYPSKHKHISLRCAPSMIWENHQVNCYMMLRIFLVIHLKLSLPFLQLLPLSMIGNHIFKKNISHHAQGSAWQFHSSD